VGATATAAQVIGLEEEKIRFLYRNKAKSGGGCSHTVPLMNGTTYTRQQRHPF
jgi:hypothetical protein